MIDEAVFPSGWFAACTLAELQTQGVLVRTLLGHSTLLTRAPSGEPLCARVPSRWADPLHRARWQGHRLVGNGLSLRWDGQTLGAESDRAIRIELLPVHDFLGVLLFFHTEPGSALTPFALPDWSSDEVTPYKFRYFPREVFTTVKEITEDIADTHHFGPGGHGWSELDIHKFDTSREISTLDMSFTMETSVFGRFRDRMRFTSHFEAIGVGLFIGTVKSELRDLDSRPLICYTPTTSPRRIQLIYGESHRRMRDPRLLHKLFGLVPRRAVDPLVSLQSLIAMHRDVKLCDVQRWETAAYLRERRGRTDPLLTDYRRWVSRFYAEPAAAMAEAASLS